MRTVTDSYVVHYNEDGSKTTTETYTTYPNTKKETAVILAVNGVLLASPLIAMYVIVKLENRAEKRQARKAAKTK